MQSHTASQYSTSARISSARISSIFDLGTYLVASSQRKDLMLKEITSWSDKKTEGEFLCLTNVNYHALMKVICHFFRIEFSFEYVNKYCVLINSSNITKYFICLITFIYIMYYQLPLTFLGLNIYYNSL